MASLEKKRDDFRKYLEGAGAIDNLTKALIKLYEEQHKPKDAVKFIRNNMCESCPDDDQYQILAADLIEANKKICSLEREISGLKGNIKLSASEVNLALSNGFNELTSLTDCNSMLRKFLTKDVFDKLKDLRTENKGTLLDCIKSGLENPNSSIGVYACDPEAYTLFAPLFDPIIEEYHGFKKDDNHPALDFGESCKLPDLDPEGKYVVSTRIRCGRSLDGFPFASILKIEQYEEIFNKSQEAVKSFSGDLKGKFHPLEAMSKEMKKQLIEEHILFKEDDKYLASANACRFWPISRAIFINDAKTFAIWCNEEDHIRIISMESGADIRNVYERLLTATNKLSELITFQHHDRLGFLTFCPTNLGNTIRASVHIKLPKLSLQKEKLDELAAQFHLQVRGTDGEHSDATDHVYDVSNKRRMGLTEFESVNEMADGILELIKAE
ncbi:unnamed protein product, partial [Diamesa serratosioi]